MKQMARNLTDGLDGFLNECRYLIHDRSSLFTPEFSLILESIGIKAVRLPARSPNLNAYAERFVRTIREGCVDRVVLIGEGSLHRAVSQFLAHYHAERNHRGWATRSFGRSFRSFLVQGMCSVESGWATCSDITTAQQRECLSVNFWTLRHLDRQGCQRHSLRGQPN